MFLICEYNSRLNLTYYLRRRFVIEFLPKSKKRQKYYQKLEKHLLNQANFFLIISQQRLASKLAVIKFFIPKQRTMNHSNIFSSFTVTLILGVKSSSRMRLTSLIRKVKEHPKKMGNIRTWWISWHSGIIEHSFGKWYQSRLSNVVTKTWQAGSLRLCHARGNQLITSWSQSKFIAFLVGMSWELRF